MQLVKVPSMDLVSFAFDAQEEYNEHKPLFIDAQCPELCVSASLARSLVKTMIAGLRNKGLQKGDAVLLCIGNHVSTCCSAPTLKLEALLTQ